MGTLHAGSFALAWSAVKTLHPKAEVAQAQIVLVVNISMAWKLKDILRTNLGPKASMKMLVSGARDIKLTKDGKCCFMKCKFSTQQSP